jgi:hypothetical protein
MPAIDWLDQGIELWESGEIEKVFPILLSVRLISVPVILILLPEFSFSAPRI